MQSESRFERRFPWRAITRRCIMGTEKVELMKKTRSNSMPAPLCSNETVSIFIPAYSKRKWLINYWLKTEELLVDLMRRWGISARNDEWPWFLSCKLWYEMIICHAWTHTPLYKYLYKYFSPWERRWGRLVVWGRSISRIGDANLLFEVSFPPLECLVHLCNG